MNEVIRVQKRPNEFVLMDKGFLENPELSWKAKGILAYLLTKPNTWKVIVKDLVSRSTDGKSAIYSALKELTEKGYYAKNPIRDSENKRIECWRGIVSEMPMDSLLSDFQDIENQEIENQDPENQEHSNNYISNNDKSNNQSSPVLSGVTGRQEAIEAYTEIIKDNIGYADLVIAKKYDLGLIDEFVAIILDVLISSGKTIRIGGEDKPRELVKHTLLRLDYGDIDLVLEQFKGLTCKIRKKKQYILSMLYHAKLESNLHYTNLVSADMWRGGVI